MRANDLGLRDKRAGLVDLDYSPVDFIVLCHPDCPWCARAFWRWLKGRMAAMSVRKGGITSFAEAAATSIKAP